MSRTTQAAALAALLMTALAACQSPADKANNRQHDAGWDVTTSQGDSGAGSDSASSADARNGSDVAVGSDATMSTGCGECAEGTACAPHRGAEECRPICQPGSTDCPSGCRNDLLDAVSGVCAIPTGATCPGTIPDVGDGCDPIAQDCPAGEHCEYVVTGADPIVFAATCRQDPGRAANTGESCTESAECGIAMSCFPRTSSCLRYCRRSDALGCKAGEVCAPFKEDFAYGYCGSTCDQFL